MADSTATVNIPKDVLEPILRQQVAAEVTAALGNPADLIAKVVEFALSQKVNADGKRSSYEHDNRHSFIEVAAKNAIHKAVHEILAQWIEEQRPAIAKHVEAALGRRKSAFAKALVEGLANSVKSSWTFNCEINLNGK